MPFLITLGDLHTSFTGVPSEDIGNTFLETTLNKYFYANGVYDIDFDALINVDTNFGIKDFYLSTYNPIPNYNTKFSIEHLTSSFITGQDTVYFSTDSAELIDLTYKTISTPPFYVGSAPLDFVYENICANNQVFFTALALNEPDAGETYYFSDKFKVNEGKKFTDSAASRGLFAPYWSVPHSSFFSVRVLAALESQQFSSRLSQINSNWDSQESFQNISLYSPVSDQENKTNLFLSYDIKVNNTLDSNKSSLEYYLRKSGFQGMFIAPIEFEISGTFDSTVNFLDIYHKIYQVATINTNDKINFTNPVAAFTSVRTDDFVNYPNLNLLNIDNGINIRRYSFYGNSPFFEDEFVSVYFSNCYYGYTFINDTVKNIGKMNDTFSTILTKGDLLAIEDLCIGKTPDFHSNPDYSSNSGNMIYRQNVFSYKNCYPEIELYVSFGDYGVTHLYENFNYLNNDLILADAAKEISIYYPNRKFNLPRASGGPDYNNYLTTYWSNNLT